MAFVFINSGSLCTAIQARMRFLPRKPGDSSHLWCRTEEDVFITGCHAGDSEAAGGRLVCKFWGGWSGEGCTELLLECHALVLRNTWREQHVVCKAWWCCDDTLCEIYSNYSYHVFHTGFLEGHKCRSYMKDICELQEKGERQPKKAMFAREK